ncbi:hypothetical protein [Variovorax sp. JS1663]|uniref:hypothetical protein n=1 Tax=Variovorax sp. JS1663 TaxID=1851577 RepID=UPI000B3435FA|nr:hypothetical protein [Variovorax sp. JS1663]OUM01367.1 hypothetical protein A8M77_16510 [Variovorax sp. JS1663]
MSALDFLIHLLNFAAPAFFVALLLALLFRLAMKSRSAVVSLWKQLGINFLAGLAVLMAGLVYFGRDGRIATYAALVIVCGTVQWWLLRGWRS